MWWFSAETRNRIAVIKQAYYAETQTVTAMAPSCCRLRLAGANRLARHCYVTRCRRKRKRRVPLGGLVATRPAGDGDEFVHHAVCATSHRPGLPRQPWAIMLCRGRPPVSGRRPSSRPCGKDDTAHARTTSQGCDVLQRGAVRKSARTAGEAMEHGKGEEPDEPGKGETESSSWKQILGRRLGLSARASRCGFHLSGRASYCRSQIAQPIRWQSETHWPLGAMPCQYTQSPPGTSQYR